MEDLSLTINGEPRSLIDTLKYLDDPGAPSADNLVDSVFGRTGAVTADSGDYSASHIINDSVAPGATVAGSLEALEDGLKEMKVAAARAIIAPESDNPQISLELPDAVKRRDFLLGFTSSGAVTTTTVATVATMDALAAQGLSGIATVANINALRDRAGARDEVVFLAGYYAAADGGDGFFAWDANSTEPDDGGIIIASNPANAGRWKRCARGDSINVKWFGAKLDGVTDDTAAIQAAIDTRLAPVFIPAAPLKSEGIIVSQLQVYNGTKLFGVGPGTRQNVGTRLKQKSGCNLSMIVSHSSIANWEYMHSTKICDMQLEGDWVNAPGAKAGASSTRGCGIEMLRRTGENFLIENVHVRRFAESGIRITRGSTPGGIFNCASFWNGEYGFDLQKSAGDVWHQFAVRSVSGDSNGVALIRVKRYGGHIDSMYIDGVKAETSSDQPGTQQDVVVVDGSNHCPINISNITQYSALSTRSIVRIVGTGARVVARNFRASHTCENWFSDASNSEKVREMPKEGSQSSAVIDGVWASRLDDPSVNIKTSANF